MRIGRGLGTAACWLCSRPSLCTFWKLLLQPELWSRSRMSCRHPPKLQLFHPAVPELRGSPGKGATGMDTGKGQLSLLPHCCQLQNVSLRTPKTDLFRVHKFLSLRTEIRTFPADTNCDRKQQSTLTTAEKGRDSGKLSTRGPLSPEGRGLFSLHSISSSTLCWKLAKLCNAQSIAAQTLFPGRGPNREDPSSKSNRGDCRQTMADVGWAVAFSSVCCSWCL